MIATLRSCFRKAELMFFLHYKLKEVNVHLHAGKAYAAGLEVARKAYYEEGDSEEIAMAKGIGRLLTEYGDFQCPEDSPKSATRMAGALEYYFSRYPLSTDKATPLILADGRTRAIEFGGLEALDIRHPESGDPLQYSWRMDMAVDFEKMHLGLDDKTTSSLGPSWARTWDLRSQFTGYVWGPAQHGIKLDGFLVRGVSILKTRYDTLPALTYRPPWQISRWYDQLHRDLERAIRAWREGYFDFNLDHACEEYGGCPFKAVCLSREPAPILSALYTRRIWDPVRRLETVLEGEEKEYV